MNCSTPTPCRGSRDSLRCADLHACAADGFSALFADAEVTLGVHLDATPGARVWVGYDDPTL
ncbi:MAG: hypothetical protein IPL29_02310 [Propionivibrio sp.]|nr:hypothetical protein [Propionivibrio sp.]